MNSHCLKPHYSYLISVQCHCCGNFSGVNSVKTVSPSAQKEKENCLVFMFSIKRESGKFHVVMINDTLRGLQSPKGGFQEGP